MNENWKDVVGFEGIYQVSDRGNLRALDRVMPSGRWGFVRRKGGPIKTKRAKNGYLVVGLRANGTRKWVGVHRLVCEAFNGSAPAEKPFVAHYPDPTKTNNSSANLRWATPLENSIDRLEHGTLLKGELNPAAKVTADIVRVIRSEYEKGGGNKLAARFGISSTQVMYIVHGKAWSHV